MKRCPKCERNLEDSCFYKNRCRHDGLQVYCKDCSSEIARQRGYNNKSPESKAKNLVKKKQDYWADPEAARVKNRAKYKKATEEGKAWHQRNRERHKATSKCWRREHPERSRQIHKDYRERDPERIAARHLRYARAHPELFRKYVKERRLRKLGAFVESVDIDVLREVAENICYLCGQYCSINDQTMDHVIPLSKGGLHEYKNCRLAHRSCNSRKGTRFLSELDWCIANADLFPAIAEATGEYIARGKNVS